MPSRKSTLIRENARDLGKWRKLTKAEEQEIVELQNRILYGGDYSQFGNCITCNKKPNTKTRTDHLISAVYQENARFRNGKILATEHPMNMVWCCSGACNNEINKAKAIEKNKQLKDYYEYVLTHIPTNPITEEEFTKLNNETIANEIKRIEHIKYLRGRCA